MSQGFALDNESAIVLTIFSIPKPFIGHIGVIQRNAIRNWKSLHRDVQVILMGNEEGVADVARMLHCEHEPVIALSDYGTPRVDAAFQLADRLSRHPILVYANGDILFVRRIIEIVREIAGGHKRYLFTGHKWLADVSREMSQEEIQSESVFEVEARTATMAGATGIDFFCYPRGQYRSMPPLIVGRPGWDNWMLYDTIRRKIPVIIPDRGIVALHQNHDTEHVPNKEVGTRWEGPEAETNRRSIGCSKRLEFSLDDADHYVTVDGQLSRRQGDYRKNRRKIKALHPILYWIYGA